MEIFLTLNNAQIGKKYTILGMCQNIDIKTKTRLFELGFLKGNAIKVLSRSISGGVLLVEINSTCLTIRKDEASCVVIK